MFSEIESLIARMERGEMDRRQIVAAIGAFVLAAASGGRVAAGALGASSTFQATALDHIALGVTDVRRSRDFYKKHLGLTVRRDNGEHSCFLDCGDNFVALFRSQKPGMHHYCYSIKDFNLAEVIEKLESAGLKHHREQNRIYFEDPDKLTVQLAR